MCPTCKKRFTGSEVDDGTVCAVEIAGVRYFIHIACWERVKNFKLSDEERALMAQILDYNYLEQEKMADALGISRSELLAQTRKMLSDF